MRKDIRAAQALAAIDPSWRALIEQRVAANRQWRHLRCHLALAMQVPPVKDEAIDQAPFLSDTVH